MKNKIFYKKVLKSVKKRFSEFYLKNNVLKEEIKTIKIVEIIKTLKIQRGANIMEISILLICSLAVNALLFTSNAIRCGKCIERIKYEEDLRLLKERQKFVETCERCKYGHEDHTRCDLSQPLKTHFSKMQ